MQSLVSEEDYSQNSNRNRAIKCFIALLLIYSTIGIILLIVFTPSYMVNDDLAMAAIISGDYTGRSVSDLIFIGHLAAFPLWVAYKISANTPWYTIFVTWGSFVGLSVIGTTIFMQSRKVLFAPFMIYFAASIFILPTVTLEVTFTITAFILTASGILLLLTAAKNVSYKKLLYFCAVLAVLFASSIRKEAAIASLVLALPLFISCFLKLKFRTTAVIISLVVGSLGCNFLLDNLSTSSDWKLFNSFNKTRGLLHGTQKFESLAMNIFFGDPASIKAAESIGWTKDEVINFWAWNFDSPNLFNVQKVRDLSSIVGKQPQMSISEALSTVTENRNAQLKFLFFVILLTLIFSKKRGLLLILLTTLWAAAVFIWIATTQRFPDRIATPLFFIVAVLICFVLSQNHTNLGANSRSTRVYLLHFCVAVVLSLAFANLTIGNGSTSSKAASDRGNFKRQTYLTQVDQLNSVDPTGRFVYVGAVFSAEGSDPYSARTSYAGDLILGLGWPTFSPVYEDRKIMMGLTKNLVASLAEQENLYYVLNPTFIDSTTRLFSAIYGEQLHFEVLGGLSSGAVICQIRPV